MKWFPLLVFFFLVTVGIVVIRSRKFPYRFLCKPQYVEGSIAVVLGLIIVIVGILFYFVSIEDLL